MRVFDRFCDFLRAARGSLFGVGCSVSILALLRQKYFTCELTSFCKQLTQHIFISPYYVSLSLCVYIYVHVCMCVCIYMCIKHMHVKMNLTVKCLLVQSPD